MSRSALFHLLVLTGGIVLFLFAADVDLEWLRGTNIYGNFDRPAERAFVSYLWIGTPDSAIGLVYRFGHGLHATPLVALGAIFLIFFVLQRFGNRDVRLGISRWLTAWCAFVVARFGLLRVSGAAPVSRCTYGIFPFLNCQACEMASGGCPIGAFQHSLIQGRFPTLALTTLALTGLFLGRWICAWLCPFGMLSDLFDRLSKRVWKPSIRWAALKYVALVAIVVIPLWMYAAGADPFLPFCGTVCASGIFFGLLPFYATTGAADFGTAVTGGNGPALAVILFHTGMAVLFLWLTVKISGRVFCRYLCPMGAFLGLFHRISFVRIAHVGEDCRECGKCERDCPMGVDLADPSFLVQSQCVRCGRCVKFCPTGARQWLVGFGAKPRRESKLVTEIPVLRDAQG
ncbi:MAG: 4Fe-4S binding protein [Planctomycetota bacterium]